MLVSFVKFLRLLPVFKLNETERHCLGLGDCARPGRVRSRQRPCGASPNLARTGEIAMYVDMKIEKRKVNAVGQGWLSPLLGLYKVPVHSLIVSITFSESEKAAIKARKLEAERIINKPYIFTDALASRGVYLHRSISLSSFLRGPVTIDYRVLWEAQEAMRKLEENLNALKANLSRPDAPTPMTRRFEV